MTADKTDIAEKILTASGVGHLLNRLRARRSITSEGISKGTTAERVAKGIVLGTVARFNEGRGFGFINPNDGSAECFAHYSEVQDEDERLLFPGEEVKFTVQTDDRGRLQAKEIVRTENRHRGVVNRFQDGYGFIARPDGEPEVFVHYTDIVSRGYKRLEAGEGVTFAVVTGDKGPKAVRVRRLDTRRPFERFALLPRYDDHLKKLSELAQKENWNYRHAKSTQSFPILRSFLLYTFARLEAENKIATTERDNEQVACFNTGLATDGQEAIFGVFRPNRYAAQEADPPDPPWVLDQFARESDRVLTCFASKPDIASSFTG